MNKNKSKNSIYSIVLILLILLFALLTILFIFKLKNELDHSYAYEYSEIERQISKSDYPTARSDLLYNSSKKAKSQEDTSQFELVTEYFEKAELYEAYQKNGDKEKTAEYEKALKSLESQITDQTAVAAVEDIQGRFHMQ